MKERSFDHGEISGFLDEGTQFNGDLVFHNTMRIDGKFTGTIESKNFLIVGETAEIEGEVNVSNVSINGKVSGKIIADSKVEIHSKGKVFCDIDTPKLVVEDGAFFRGNCNMMMESEKEPAKAPQKELISKEDTAEAVEKRLAANSDRLGKNLRKKN
jgi:cytoskeletal protein CcmA (bactofilin family)